MGQNSMQLRAPAKINLSFRIIQRRPDGFHEIETRMAPISLFDEITLSLGEGGEEVVLFRCDDPTLPTGDDNLAVKAARLFRRETKLPISLTIDLKKRIPHGAGLAGGSSDAATVLLGLNQICGAGLSVTRLSALAAEIGSDVPFFISQSAAVCRGRGEIVDPAKLEQPLRLLLLKPAFGVATPWAYGRWKDSKEVPGIDSQAQEFAGNVFVNDLERPVFEKHLFLAQAKMWLRAQAEVGAALMSGSGSTLFAVLREDAEAETLAVRAKEELDPELWTHACETR
ncbi:MAG: 4-(cytidine 5'-diphospho)-2-C-methyl-D-erythritol kinase [Chthoniobacterales bacterium]